MDVAEIPLPPPLERLLAELEAPSPSIQEFEVDLSSHEFGGFFEHSSAQEDGARARVHQRVRLRVLRAIGNCTSLRTIDLNPSVEADLYSVTEVEAEAFLQALQQSNHMLEGLDVSGWRGFGSAAACVALAGLLRSSRTLTELRLWNVGLTSKGVGHIAAALRAPHASSLQVLHVSQNPLIGRGSGGAPHLADIITNTSTLCVLHIYDVGMDRAGGEMIANALASNRLLEELGVGWSRLDGADNQSAELTMILRALTPPVTHEGGSRDHSPIQIARHMPNIKTLMLIVVDFHKTSGSEVITPELGEALTCMLRSNTCLQTLRISTCFIGHGLEALSDSTSIIGLEVGHDGLFDEHVDFAMLTSTVQDCKQLQSLTFWNDVPAEAKRQIFEALKDNRSIKRLVINNWENLDDDMFEVLMTSLQVNTILETISMKGTMWERGGKAATVNELLKRNKRQVAYLDRLHHGNIKFHQPKVGRLFLCGSAFAGKTTLKTSLIHSHSSLYNRWLKPMRTQGIEVEMLMDSNTMQVSIWDLAGQDEYRALQSLLFPSISQACIFFFVFSRYDQLTGALKVLDDLANELDHWLRFIASNTLAGNDVLPQVVVVITHLDKMPRGTTAPLMVEWATPIVTKLTERYNGLLDISPTIFVVKATSHRSIAPIRQTVVDLFAELFGKLKLVPEACTRMTTVLAKWRSHNSKWPIMRLSEFNDLCFESVEALHRFNKQDEQAVSILQAIASYMHDVGIIMFFQKLGIVVVDPNWISHVFLGRLLRSQKTTGASTSNVLPSNSDGFVPEVALQTALRCFLDKKRHRGFDEKDMINLMLELKLCYQEQDPGALGVIRYFVPNTLTDATGNALRSLRKLQWPLANDGCTLQHVGRRLQCKDKLRTYLDPGFFPRFQVILQTSLFAKRPEMKSEQYRNELNLIAFHTDGIEVFIEMPGDVGDLIDILVRSRKTPEQTRAFVVRHVLDEIRSFCASSQGSQGVELVEGVIRPDCVTNLTLCKHRRDQAVLKSELMGHLLGEHVLNEDCGPIFIPLENLDYQHTWNKVDFDGAGLPACAERADGLLDPEDMFEVLKKREMIVQQQLVMVKKAAKVVLCETHEEEDSKRTRLVASKCRNTTSYGGTMFDLGFTHRTLQKEVRRKVQDITLLQEQTLVAVSSRMNKIMNFSTDFLNSELPRRPYFKTNDVGTSRKLVEGVQLCNAVTLHFMCEGPQGNHMVARQGGLPLTVENGKWEWIQPIAVQSARMLVFLVKAGLDVAAGIGSAVPDFAGWTGAIPQTEAALAGERLLDAINAKFPASSALEHSKCAEGAWLFLMDELEPQLEAGKMGELFQLSKVQLKQDVGGHERQVAWLCNECLAREKGRTTTNLESVPPESTPWNTNREKTAINHVVFGSENDRTWASSAGVPQEVLEDCYPDTNVNCGKMRGAAVIISMEAYTNGRRRRGAEVDRGRLETLANSLKLNYDGRIFLNSPADFVREELLDIARTGIMTGDECFVCFVNAHGSTGRDGAFFFTDCDGSPISLLTDVVEPFRRCKNLIGKPKIFFINACRGGLKLQSMEDTVDGLGAGAEQPVPSSWSEGAERRYVEQEADCLLVFSTSQQAASPRDVEYGTNFVYALIRALNKNRASKDLLTILTHMTYDVVDMNHEETDAASGKVRVLRQCPVVITTLRKLVYWRSL